MIYLKSYIIYDRVSKETKIIESVGQDLPDILLEINDEILWKANCWSNSQDGKWVIIIQTAHRGDEEHEESELELEGQPITPIIIECIERAIDFMNDEGFTNYQIILLDDHDYNQYEKINIKEFSDLCIWSSEFIRIEFWK